MDMKSKSLIFTTIISILSFSSCIAQNESKKIENGLYFGQKPPGVVAEPFASSVLAFEPHDSPIISQDETWMIIGTTEQGVKFYTSVNGKLSLSTNPLNFDIPFSEIPYSYNGMEISRSEKKIIFLIWINNNAKFYSIEKAENSWTPPKLMGKELNSISTHWQFTVANNENLYLMVRKQGICISEFNGKSYIKPIQLILDDGRNMDGGTPYIAPDESYIIYSLDDDLQISYKLSNGKWTLPQNLGRDINSDGLDLCPRISPNGKYLFFVSGRFSTGLAIYWANASFIEKLKPRKNIIE